MEEMLPGRQSGPLQPRGHHPGRDSPPWGPLSAVLGAVPMSQPLALRYGRCSHLLSALSKMPKPPTGFLSYWGHLSLPPPTQATSCSSVSPTPLWATHLPLCGRGSALSVWLPVFLSLPAMSFSGRRLHTPTHHSRVKDCVFKDRRCHTARSHCRARRPPRAGGRPWPLERPCCYLAPGLQGSGCLAERGS